MTANHKFRYMLGMDCETTGVILKSKNPAIDLNDPDRYAQAISWGFVVIDSETLEEVDNLYIEIKYDGKAIWSKTAEKIHGLSQEYLDQHGRNEEDAVCEIGSFLMKYFGTEAICPLGHNVRFDVEFFYLMMERYDLPFRFTNRMIDTMPFALILQKCYNSDQLFKSVGLEDRAEHNALEDIRMTVESLRRIRAIYNLGVNTLMERTDDDS